MYCSNCGTKLDSNARFCNICGQSMQQGADAEHQTENVHNSVNQQAATAESATENNQSEYVEKGKEVGKNYLNFVLQVLKRPFSASQQLANGDKVNGLITMLIFSLLLPLYMFTLANQVSPDYFRIPFFDVVLKPFFILLIFFAIIIAVNFGVAQLMKVNLSYIQVFNIYGTLMVLPTAVLLIAFIFLLLTIHSFSGILLTISLAVVTIVNTATLFSIKSYGDKHQGLDVIYGIIITNIALVIILLLIGDGFVGNLMRQIENSFYYF